MSGTRLRLWGVWLALGAVPAFAQGPSSGHELSGSYNSLLYGGFFRSGPEVPVIELSYHHGFGADSALRLGGGIRAGIPNSAGPISGNFVGGELFGQLQLRVRLWLWEPVVGPEVGLSGLTAIGWARGGMPEDVYALEQRRVGAIFVAFTAAPLRFRWRALTASVLEVSFGTTLSPPGATARIRVGVASLGVVL